MPASRPDPDNLRENRQCSASCNGRQKKLQDLAPLQFTGGAQPYAAGADVDGLAAHVDILPPAVCDGAQLKVDQSVEFPPLVRSIFLFSSHEKKYKFL